MLTTIHCPTCKVRLQTPENLLGKTILCPKCKKRVKLVVPQEPDPTAGLLETTADLGTEPAPEIDEVPAEPKASDDMDNLDSLLDSIAAENAEEAKPEDHHAETIDEPAVEEEVVEEEIVEEEIVEEVVMEEVEEEPAKKEEEKSNAPKKGKKK